MAEQVDLHTGPGPRPVEDGGGALESSGETDSSLAALIRRALDASRPSTHPGGPGGGAGEGDASAHRFGKFEVLREIGRGTFGTVLLVRDPDLGRERALKLPNEDTLASPGALARFLAEARLAARVDHPNVVRVHEAATLDAIPYIVMEYCPGGSLGRWLAARSSQDPLPHRWAVALVAEIAEGVHQAHLAGLLHRDIKPGNILLEQIPREDGSDPPRFRPKIADFGLAKVFEQDGDARSMTATGTPIGTWAYMSPEQARGDKEIRATTDVYAIGAILHELLTGRRPHEGLGQAEILARLLGPDPAPSPRTTRKGLHRDLETICLRCLERAPTDRYQNSSELANDLRRHLDGLPILARPAPLWKKATAWSRRHPARIAATGLVVLAVAGVLSWSEAKERQDASAWLERMGVANLSGLAELVTRRQVDDPQVAPKVGQMFDSGTPAQKLAAAVFLAPVRTDCASHAIERLLTADHDSLGPLARALSSRLDMGNRLKSTVEAKHIPGASLADREALDRRRSKAATALVLLGDGEPGWQLLKFEPDPQARSFLVHDLGPSGVAPATILKRLEFESDPTIRRMLIQGLGQVPDGNWTAPRKAAEGRLLAIYCDDPDRGIHGSAKWLLKRWKLDDEIEAADRELARRPVVGPPAEWRVSPSLLTFVTVTSPMGDRLIEILDTEVTVEFFRRSRPDHKFNPICSPEPSCPVNTITYHDAARFCDALNLQEGYPASYRRAEGSKGVEPAFESRDGYLDRSGYRLPTLEELIVACKAGTSTSRYYGEADGLLGSYAWAHAPERNQLFPVATLKPNDYGVFDLLGNVFEIGQSSKFPKGQKNQAVLYGGSTRHPPYLVRSDYHIDGFQTNQRIGTELFGFRVARTLRAASAKHTPTELVPVEAAPGIVPKADPPLLQIRGTP